MKSAFLLCGAACALVFSAPALAQQATAADKPVPVAELVKQVDIPFETFTLANGLRVIVHTDRKAPVVAVSVWYNVGSKMEPEGKTGFAHLFEHLMFGGSENSPVGFFEPLQEVGATDANGTTWFDRTNYFETVPTGALDRALFLESDRMGWLLGAVTQSKLDNQRSVVQNEKRQGDNQPYGLVEYAEIENLFPSGHPYGHSTIGSMSDLDKASLEDVKGWFREHYGPNNAVLVLAGDIDAKTAKPLVEKYFGPIKAGPTTPPVTAPIPTLPARKQIVLKDHVATTRIYREWVVPGLNDPQAPALDVAASVLGGLASSRLDNQLVRKEQLAVSVSADLQEYAQVSMFVVTADVKPGVDAALVEKRLDEIISGFVAKGPSEDEVQRVVTSQVANRIRGLEQVGGFGGKAVALAEGALYSNDPGYYKKRLNALAATTPASVTAAMQQWLTRPVLAIRVEPGTREAYAETAVATKPKSAAAAEAPVKGTRGPLPAVGEIGNLDFPKVTRTKLSNGIELVYAQRTAVPITQAVVSFDAGGAADRADKLGTQTLTLSMLDEGTKTHDSIAIAEMQERLGARIGSGSSADRTTVSMSAPTPNLTGAVDLLADVVRNPAFAPAEVDRVRNQQLAAIAQELSSPGGLATRVVPPLIYGAASPYAKLAAGSGDPVAVKTLAPADLAAFHNAWIRPDKARIFVISDKPLAEVKAVLEHGFGDWKAVGTAGVKPNAAAVQATPKIVLVNRPDSPQSVIIGGQLTPARGTDELLPFIAANDVLGGNFLSRINMNLREDKGWSYGVSGSPQRLEHAVGYLLRAPVQADRTGDSIKALQGDVTAFLTTKGVTQVEFERTINGFVRELSGSFETSDDVIEAMQRNDLFQRPDDYYATIAQKYRALTPAELDAAARATLKPDRFVWVVVGDAAKVRPQLDSIGLPVEVTGAATAPTPAAK